MLQILLNSRLLDKETAADFSFVLSKAIQQQDMGVIAWVERAIGELTHLGKLRDRDINNLLRLKEVYSNDYYTKRQPIFG